MAEYYNLKVAGLERKLAICEVNEHLDIAGFIMFSDVELTVACARELLKKVPDFDVIVTAESKGIPLAYEMARQVGNGMRYIVARKMPKLYMRDPISVDVRSITTAADQKLWLDRNEADYLSDKRILIVDDVVSTGESLEALHKLIDRTGGTIVGQAAVLAEGDAKDRKDLIYLEPLPLFFK